jgi:hypothetical protein
VNKLDFDMKQITLNIKESYYALFVQFLRSLTYVEIEKSDTLPLQPAEQDAHERQKMIDYILAYQNDKPSFGDAAEWQRHERQNT